MDNHLSSAAHLVDGEVQAEVFTPITSNLQPQVLNIDDDLQMAPEFKIPRVHPQFRNQEVRPNTYDPVAVSLGPYHHGKPELRHAEIYKRRSMDWFVSGSSCRDRFFFFGKIQERIDEIRSWYDEEVIEEYDDEALASMILHDACFIIELILLLSHGVMLSPEDNEFFDYFGQVGCRLVHQDLYLLENQIPLWIIKFLCSLQSDQGQSAWDAMFVGYLRNVVTRVANVDPERFPWAGEQYEPLHLLDVIRHYSEIPIKALHHRSDNFSYINVNYQFRSMTNLRAKGIRVSVSNPNKEIPSISFTSHSFYGHLQLPRLVLTNTFHRSSSNLIAHEASPYCPSRKLYVTCYVNFIKSLIESPNDAKILREAGILVSGGVGSDDEVAKMINDISTLGMENPNVFLELKTRLNRHCSSRRKTWMADLSHNYFANPWTGIGVFAAFCLFLLTFIQTLFTIHPAN